jgi:hypothetical protein
VCIKESKHVSHEKITQKTKKQVSPIKRDSTLTQLQLMLAKMPSELGFISEEQHN